jgi:hypothetical protein
MANGQSVGANGQPRRNRMPRIHSEEGVQARFVIRATTMPVTQDKFRDGFTRPGSRNRKKVGR